MPGEPVELCYARTGILLGLAACGLRPGDEVLLPAYHCAAMVAPVVAGGWTPRFYDVEELGPPRPASLEQHVGDRVRAVVAVHFFGAPADMSGLAEWCRARGLALVEDCTHAYYRCLSPGAPPVGTFGDVVIASPYKFLASYEGGLLWLPRAGAGAIEDVRPPTWRENLKDVYHILETSWIARRAGWMGPLVGLLVRARYLGKPSPFGPRAGGDAAPAPADDLDRHGPRLRGPARWSRSLSRRGNELEGVQERRANYLGLVERLAGTPGLVFPPLGDHVVPYAFPLTAADAPGVKTRLRAAGIDFQQFGIPPWPGTPVEGCPGAERLRRSGLQLPVHQSLAARDLDLMAAACR